MRKDERTALTARRGVFGFGAAAIAACLAPAALSAAVPERAVRLTWVTWGDVCDLVGGAISPANPGRFADGCADACGETGPFIELTLPTRDGLRVVRHGEWIVRMTDGTLDIRADADAIHARADEARALLAGEGA